jgi:hypothetical protein
MHHGPLARLELEGQAHGFEGQQQVGKDDGRIDAELFSGGDGDFSGQIGLLADFDQRVVLADVAVLLHVAAGLAQKPDGGAVDRDGADRRGRNGCRREWCLGESPVAAGFSFGEFIFVLILPGQGEEMHTASTMQECNLNRRKRRRKLSVA